MSTIILQATDTLFFRDGRPFSMGEESFAQGIFPPPPSVFYGALRSAIIAGKIKEQKTLKQLIEETSSLKINYIGFRSQTMSSKSSSDWFPMPSDLMVPKTGLNDKAIPLRLIDKPKYSSRLDVDKMLFSKEWEGKAVDGLHLVKSSTFEKYLNGTENKFEVSPLYSFIEKETKIGIGKNNESGTAEEGQLFRVLMNRPAKDLNNTVKKLQFKISFEGSEIPHQGWAVLGAERKVVHFETNDFFAIPCPVLDSNQFKIYLSTPAIFENGWKPDNLLRELGLKLVSAAIGRSVPIGGWDMDKYEPKPMLQSVTAGSVFFVQARDVESAQKAACSIHGQCISDNVNGNNYKNQGFGIAYVGNIKINA